MKSITGFQNVSLVFPEGVKKGSLSVHGDTIASFEAGKDAVRLPEGLYVAPGFIDEHIHGADGFDTMDAKIASLEGIAKALPQEGVTSWNATTMTMGLPSIEAALRNVATYMKGDHPGARVIGVHLEGPFISPKHPGAQDPAFIIKPNVTTFEKLLDDADGHINEVTMAYEEGGKDLLAYLVQHHITASMGHSDCTAALFREAVEGGLHCVTHLFNAQRGFHHREPGIVGMALLLDGVKTEIICDTIHSVPDAFALAFKAKKKEDIVLISDSTEGKYLKPGKYALGGQDVYIYDGVARLADGTIAGSILKINVALQNVSKVAKGYSYADLINLATLNPAKNLGFDDRIGSLALGHKADFVVLDKDFHVYATIVGGQVAYEKEGFSL